MSSNTAEGSGSLEASRNSEMLELRESQFKLCLDECRKLADERDRLKAALELIARPHDHSTAAIDGLNERRSIASDAIAAGRKEG